MSDIALINKIFSEIQALTKQLDDECLTYANLTSKFKVGQVVKVKGKRSRYVIEKITCSRTSIGWDKECKVNPEYQLRGEKSKMEFIRAEMERNLEVAK